MISGLLIIQICSLKHSDQMVIDNGAIELHDDLKIMANNPCGSIDQWDKDCCSSFIANMTDNENLSFVREIPSP